MKLLAIVSLLLALAGVADAQQSVRPASPESRRAARIVVAGSADNGVAINLSELHPYAQGSGAEAHILHTASRFVTVPDSLSLPGVLLNVGIPYGATDLRATFTPTKFDTIIAPAGMRAPRVSGVAGSVAVGSPVVMRGIRTVSLRLQPLRYEAGKVIAVSAGQILLSWKGGGGIIARAGSGGETRSMETVLRDEIINYDQAKRWRARNGGRSLQGSSGWGMEKGAVLLTGRDAVYRITGGELSGVGANEVLGRPIGELRLRNRATFIGFYLEDRNGNGLFDADDFIEFPGQRNRSQEGFYFDDFTDSNAYILSWNGGAQNPPRIAGIADNPNAPPMTAYDSTLHFEQENVYLAGLPDSPFGDASSIHYSDRVPGERYYWNRITFPYPTIFTFSCSPAYAPGARIRLGLRLAGVTNTPHRLHFLLNGANLGDFAIRNAADTLVEFDIPASFLINGRNQINLDIQPPPDTSRENYKTPDAVYLDYVELRGRWLPTAFDDAPKIRLSGDAPARVTMTGLTAAPGIAISTSSRATIGASEPGFLFRLTSREFDDVPLRENPGFMAELPDSFIYAPRFGIGMMLARVDGATGTLRAQKFIPLYPNNPTAMADAVAFLNDIPNGDIILAGLSVGTSDTPFNDEFKQKMAALGSRNAGSPNFVAGWLFAARKGEPSTAVEAYALFSQGDPGVTLNAFIPSPGGGSYRTAFTLAGRNGDEFQIGTPHAPPARYHGGDSLLTAANRADLLIIAHPAFLAEANRLAEHRRVHDSLVVRVVDVNRIYDEFNDGIKHSIAVHRFIQFADSAWADPAPGYILLFGDASWDAANRFGRTGNADFVPTNGIPASDYIYTVAVGDSSMMWHQMIGRLPAANTTDAHVMVDKLIEYDQMPPAAWNKRFVFMAGGGSESEVDEHQSENERIARDYILSSFFHGDTALIRRTSPNLGLPDPPTSLDPVHAREEINKGTMWVSFTGHGATDVVDLNYGNPEQFDNGNKYFVLATFSCQTGAFAEPGLPVRNERFIVYPGKGAVAAIGGTSFSFSVLDGPMKSLMYESMTEGEHDRVIGSVFTRAKYNGVFAGYEKVWSGTEDGFKRRNTLAMYSLLGDPTMKLAFRNSVELAFSDIRVTDSADAEPVPGDSRIKVRARLWNYGVPPFPESSVTVTALATISDKAQHTSTDTIVVNIGSYGDAEFHLPLGKDPGEYIIHLIADPARQVHESYLADNDTAIVLRVRGNQPLPIEPLPLGRVAGHDGVVIRLLNPPSGGGAEIVVDTTDHFDPASSFSSRDAGTMKVEELTTTWTFSIPERLRGARKFWWRATSTSGDPAVAKLFPLVETFTIDPAAGAEYIIGDSAQMALARVSNLVNGPAGVGPGERRVPILVMGMGQTRYTNGTLVSRENTSVMVDGTEYNGGLYDNLNIIVLDGIHPVAQRAYAFYRDQAGAFVKFVNDSIVGGQRVLIWTNGVSFNDSADHISVPVRAALKSLGSSYSDQLKYEDSYALIGGKGIDVSDIHESYVDAAALRADSVSPPYYAITRDTVSVPAGSGTLTAPRIGPATAWRSARLNFTGASAPVVTVFGIRRNGVRDSLFSSGGALSPISLASVNVDSFPRLELMASFPEDSTVRLTRIAVDFDPSPEIAIVPSTLRLDHDSVLQGDKGGLMATVVNLSRKYPASGFPVVLMAPAQTAPGSVDSLFIEHLAPLDSVRHQYVIPTDRLKGINQLLLTANPSDRPAEPYQQNNSLPASLRIGLDSVAPTNSIYADDNRLMDGDYTNPRPRLEIRIYDNSSLKLNDSSTVQMILDTAIIKLGMPGTVFKTTGSGNYRASFYYTPSDSLANGDHSVAVKVVDASGNATTSEFTTFRVERDLHIRNVVNWPNPFADKTTFTFMVSGAVRPRSGEIAIFTVAGRKIKSIRLGPAEVNIGFNRVDWDGLDDDHDRLANGVYLYRVSVDNGEAKELVIEKIVVMR